MTTINPTLISKLAADLAACAGAGDRADAVRAFAASGSVTEACVYAALRRAGWSSQRKRRGDTGTRRRGDTIEAHIRTVMEILAGCRYDTPARNAIEHAELTGLIPAGVVTVSDVQRARVAMRVQRADLKRATPHTRLASDGPNHVHEVDASACARWYLALDEAGRVQPLSRTTEVYANKPAPSGKPHLWRYVLTDHATGAFFIRYYLQPGEAEASLIDFLYRAWQRKPDPELYPFCGTPRILICDSGGRGAVLANLLEALEIHCEPHLPGNPRAKGQVESMMSWWERNFERLTLLDEPRSLDEWNDRAYQYAAYYSATRVHERYGLTRSECWAKHCTAVRSVPPLNVYRELAVSGPEERTVTGELTVKYNARTYNVRSLGLLVGEKVEIRRSPYRPGAILLRRTQTRISQIPRIDESGRPVGPQIESVKSAESVSTSYLIEPETVNELGFSESAVVIGEEYRGNRLTPTQRAVEELGVWSLEGGVRTDRTSTLQTPNSLLSRITSRYSVPPPEVRLSPPVAEPMLLPFDARREAVQRAREALARDLTQAEKESITAALRDGGTERQIDAVVKEVGGRSLEVGTDGRPAANVG